MPGEQLSDHWTHQSPTVVAAYRVCLELEKSLTGQGTQILSSIEKRALEKKLVNIRTLGYLLVFGPTDTAREHVARTVLADKEGGAEINLRGAFYDHLLLRAFRRARGPTPQTSRDSPPSYAVPLADVRKTVKEQPTNRSEAKKEVFVRDNFRCMVTGIVDMTSYEESEDLQKLQNILIGRDECAYIFPESLNVEIEGQENGEYAANVWEVIREFGYHDVYDELCETADLHRLQNIMTLHSDLYDCFDNLKLWFEATKTPNSYRVCSSIPRYHDVTHVPKYVQFKIPKKGLSLPSPRYLEFHATVCRVAHMSGATDYYRYLENNDPLVTKEQCSDPVESDFSVVLYARLLDVSERRAVLGTVSE